MIQMNTFDIAKFDNAVEAQIPIVTIGFWIFFIGMVLFFNLLIEIFFFDRRNGNIFETRKVKAIILLIIFLMLITSIILFCLGFKGVITQYSL